MADVTIPAGKPTPAVGTVTRVYTAGQSITSGDVVYVDSTDAGRVAKADADAEASARAVGIAVTTSAANQPCVVATSGRLVYSGASPFVQGLSYWVSTTSGAMAPEADLASGDYKTMLGVATATAVFQLKIDASGATETA